MAQCINALAPKDDDSLQLLESTEKANSYKLYMHIHGGGDKQTKREYKIIKIKIRPPPQMSSNSEEGNSHLNSTSLSLMELNCFWNCG